MSVSETWGPSVCGCCGGLLYAGVRRFVCFPRLSFVFPLLSASLFIFKNPLLSPPPFPPPLPLLPLLPPLPSAPPLFSFGLRSFFFLSLHSHFSPSIGTSRTPHLPTPLRGSPLNDRFAFLSRNVRVKRHNYQPARRTRFPKF